MDSVVRLLPGALGNPAGADAESFEDGLLEAPHFTRPAEFRGLEVPGALLSGDHAGVARWRGDASVRLTARERPDLIEQARREGRLDERDLKTLAEPAPRHEDHEATGLTRSR